MADAPEDFDEDEGSAIAEVQAQHEGVFAVVPKATRLDKALADILPDLSRSRIQALIGAGHVELGDQTITDPSMRVKQGQGWRLTVPAAVPALPQPQNIPLTIVYEDAALVVVDKPAGMVVHPAVGNHDGTLVNALLFHCAGRLSGIGGVARPGIVHRLDKDTSGLMVVAKTDAAHAALAAQFADRSLSRTYTALVWGVPSPTKGSIDAPVGRSPVNRQKMAVVERGGKHAITLYTVQQTFANTAASVECVLKTGRTHQIRVHMTHIGHPLIGDPLYGSPGRHARGMAAERAAAANAFARQALHARALRFLHPDDGRPMAFESALPLDLATLIAIFAPVSSV
jgi:23S rRNA pseudouridine1911/1915/1917 synthase